MMGRVLRSTFAATPAAALLLVGCMGGTVTPGQAPPAGTVGNEAQGGPHLMLTRSGDRRAGTVSTDAVPEASTLTYRGGPVLDHVAVSPVWWGSGVQFTTTLPGFYKAVIASSYYDWLTEYNTPTQTFGEGTLLNNGFAYAGTGSSNLSDANIQIGRAHV